MGKKETFHLMAVPRNFTQAVLEAGGHFLKLKNKKWADSEHLTLVQYKNIQDAVIHILDIGTQKSYGMMGEEYVEDISLCENVFIENRGDGYRTFPGSIEQVNCKECKKKFRKLNP